MGRWIGRGIRGFLLFGLVTGAWQAWRVETDPEARQAYQERLAGRRAVREAARAAERAERERRRQQLERAEVERSAERVERSAEWSRQLWDDYIDRMAARGATDADLEAARAAAERAMERNDAVRRRIAADTDIRLFGYTLVDAPARLGAVESLRLEIAARREQRAVEMAAHLARYEGDPERHALEKAWYEGLEAERAAREDAELAALAERMSRRAAGE